MGDIEPEVHRAHLKKRIDGGKRIGNRPAPRGGRKKSLVYLGRVKRGYTGTETMMAFFRRKKGGAPPTRAAGRRKAFPIPWEGEEGKKDFSPGLLPVYCRRKKAANF